jgi:hypothetical protein
VAAKNDRPKPIVAELGRPETQQETFERKTAATRKYRAVKTINNLWLSLIVIIGVVVIIVLIVPRDNTSRLQLVDFRSVAVSAQNVLPVPLAVPDLPAEWTSNVAQVRTATQDGVQAWFIGLLTPSDQFFGLTQAVDANPTWLVNELKQTAASGVETIDGIQWTVYDNRQSSRDVGNADYALVTESGRSTYVISGTGTPQEADAIATAISDNVKQQPAATSTSTSTGATK